MLFTCDKMATCAWFATQLQELIVSSNTILQCSEGMSCSGVFITCMSEIERVKVKGGVDIFQTVKAARTQRPHTVYTCVSYWKIATMQARMSMHCVLSLPSKYAQQWQHITNSYVCDVLLGPYVYMHVLQNYCKVFELPLSFHNYSRSNIRCVWRFFSPTWTHLIPTPTSRMFECDSWIQNWFEFCVYSIIL